MKILLNSYFFVYKGKGKKGLGLNKFLGEFN